VEKSKPFAYAHVTIVSGDQGGGKNTTCVARVRDAYDGDCIKIYLQDVRGIDNVKVLSYDRHSRIAKIHYKGVDKLIRIPIEYKLHSPMKIFSVLHLYGIPHVYCTWGQIVEWLNGDAIKDAWLLLDQYEIAGNAREGMGALGKYLEKKSYQFRKRHLEVYVLVPMERLADWTMRGIATERIYCTRDENTNMITLKIKKKGVRGTRTVTYYASEYWRNFDTDEEIRLPDSQVQKAINAAS
jgi:hypothetical protein